MIHLPQRNIQMPERSLNKAPSLRSLLKESTFDTYELIAEEYDDESHQTCRDFDEMTRRLLASKINMVMRASTILDLGGGTGIVTTVLREMVSLNAKRIHVVDPSSQMLKLYKEKHDDLSVTFEQGTATNFRPNEPYDLVVATLCDPFLTDGFLESLPRLLGNSGAVILSFPHEKWAKLVRKPEDITVTRFRDKLGGEHVARSICRDPVDVQAHLQNLGFGEVDYHVSDFTLNEPLRSDLTREALKRRNLSSVAFYAGVSGRKLA
jgi:trans-aconitate methyltransferase